ncbi:MAG TPA: DUF5668 domain-containing protein [Thermoanaerobaculia bacterium]|nr:DUF5668 domain-containing protein [Thermoanaerobaculia bacterium]
METTHIEPARPLGASPGKLLAGLFFTVAGILLVLDNFDIMESERILRLWPALLIAAGVTKLLTGGSRVVAVILILIGTGLLGDNLGLVRFSLFDLWPLMLIGGGLVMVAGAFGWRLPERPASSQQSGVAMFSNKVVAETTRDYRGGNAMAFLGGYTLDLTGADITNGPAVLDVFAFWGGVEIFIPDTWEVVSEVTPFMAGFEAAASGAADPTRRLIVRGAAMMAGIEVKNASRRKS